MLSHPLMPANRIVKSEYLGDMHLKISILDHRLNSQDDIFKVKLKTSLCSKAFNYELVTALYKDNENPIVQVQLLEDELLGDENFALGPSDFEVIEDEFIGHSDKEIDEIEKLLADAEIANQDNFYISGNNHAEEQVDHFCSFDQLFEDPIFLEKSWGEIYKRIYAITSNAELSAEETKKIYTDVESHLKNWVQINLSQN